MISILTTTSQLEIITKTIFSVDRLEELVEVITNKEQINNSFKLLEVREEAIHVSLDWNDTEAPYILPTIDFTKNNLLAIIFYKLGNHQKSFEFIEKENPLFNHLLIATYLQFNYVINNDHLDFLKINLLHNLAIVYNFGNFENSVSKQLVQNTYEEAIKKANTDTEKLFTIKHYVNLLLDSGLKKDAEKLIRSVSKVAKFNNESNAMNSLLATTLMAQLEVPYQTKELIEIAELQEKVIAYFKTMKLPINEALVLLNASEIANFQEDFQKANNLINKALLIFKNENLTELLGEASYQKAIILYNWSKNGSPQYYKPSINTFQNALKVFKRDKYPEKHADIQHNLAIIYSEIKVSPEEKPIWTAFCASAFKEALNIYTKENYPYQFAMVSHNYATALMGFPEAKLHNNLDKAFHIFEQALSIRTAELYPFERALTLLNQLELYWMKNNEEENEINIYNEMLIKANEISSLVSDSHLIEKATEHLERLQKLNKIIN